ncbi:gluconokinase [Flavihumibacter sp. ZG627]|uniref:gluconokinase n=1 Tax=Flavihumibacter sp. ZG627 TaxID=1463156 RepID=UPI0006942BF8|nr:gluconokinase [Flavihumibacter sp. ZG627]
MQYFAGVDIGTTHTKLLVCDERLHLVYQSKRGYTKGAGAILDAPEILDAVKQLLSEAGESLSLFQKELTVCFSSAMHSIMLVDDNNHPITPLYTWADNSAAPIIQDLKANVLAQGLFEETGTPIHPMSPLCKLAWINHTDPTQLSRTGKCTGIKEYIWFHLTGEWETDHSIASATGMFSTRSRQWYGPALTLAGIRKDQLPEPVPVEFCRQGNSAIHGLPFTHIKWVIGGSDGGMAQLGSNALKRGEAALTIGTSGAIRVAHSELSKNHSSQLFTYILDEQFYITGAATNNGGIVLQWWEEKVMKGDRNAATVISSFIEMASAVPPGADGMICVPWFGGERAPVWDAGATGIFSGISINHRQEHFKRAILEGIGYSFRLLLHHLETATGNIHTIHASGGFTANKWWVQLMADILDRKLVVPSREADASAMGAIATGMRSQKIIVDYDAFFSLLKGEMEEFIPNAQTKSIYNSNYQQFLRLCHS